MLTVTTIFVHYLCRNLLQPPSTAKVTVLLPENVHSVQLSKQKDNFNIQRTVMKDMPENARNCKRNEQSSLNELIISDTGSNGTMFANFSQRSHLRWS